ncbi:hypothetical protein [Brevibacterium luteolum]|uniref:MFS transporter n=1 Tax=Brevibacterium luteolum TaxID=199591 RepID=A0A2N6PFQ5_9MICO|nr:hypothetical protein [Brevibacterium luteolum]MCT1872955.1 hypothetical protein [Brevibacterium luteolum]MCT1892827.1 hypothetical protein [Brevibacterium luteolum]PMB97512.1 hypothetical protein CJ198_10675 [Brevibacterium luteolum]
MAIDRRKLARRARRYWAIVIVICTYFGFHSFMLTGLAVMAPNLGLASLTVTIYMGLGILLDSPAASAIERYGLRRVIGTSGILILLITIGLLIAGSGWWIVIFGALYACCSSLIYIPALAHYASMLGERQADGQRINVFIQRGGALAAGLFITWALAAEQPRVLFVIVATTGLGILVAAWWLPGPSRDRHVTQRVPLLRTIVYSVAAIGRSSVMARGALSASALPVIFITTSSIFPLALPEFGAAIGVGLVIRELIAMATATAFGHGSMRRTNREFAASVLLALIGISGALWIEQNWAVITGIILTGPLISSAIVTSSLNTRMASLSAAHPWACFAGMGIASRTSGLLIPLVLSAALSTSRQALEIVLVIVLMLIACGMLIGRQRQDGLPG